MRDKYCGFLARRSEEAIPFGGSETRVRTERRTIDRCTSVGSFGLPLATSAPRNETLSSPRGSSELLRELLPFLFLCFSFNPFSAPFEHAVGRTKLPGDSRVSCPSSGPSATVLPFPVEEKKKKTGELRLPAATRLDGPRGGYLGQRGLTEGASHARLGHEPRPSDLLTISIARAVHSTPPPHCSFRLLREESQTGPPYSRGAPHPSRRRSLPPFPFLLFPISPSLFARLVLFLRRLYFYPPTGRMMLLGHR